MPRTRSRAPSRSGSQSLTDPLQGPRYPGRVKTATFIPLEGPNLPPGYGRHDTSPSKEDTIYAAYKQGRKMEAGAPQCFNPFNPGTAEHLAFHNGWHASREQRKAFYAINALKADGVEVVLQKSVRGHLKRQLFKRKEPVLTGPGSRCDRR
jgi:hypothetical protein